MRRCIPQKMRCEERKGKVRIHLQERKQNECRDDASCDEYDKEERQDFKGLNPARDRSSIGSLA